MIDTDFTLVDVLAPLGALAGALLFVHLRGAYGADDDFWTPLRHRLLPKLERVLATVVDDGYATSTSTPRQYAATVDMGADAIERVLEQHGGVQGPIAAVKEDPQGRKSDASWKIRELQYAVPRRVFAALERLPLAGDMLFVIKNVIAFRQLHLTLYENDDGTTDVYAHEEPNAINPLTAVAHYEARKQELFGEQLGGFRVQKGIAMTREKLSAWGVSWVSMPSKTP